MIKCITKVKPCRSRQRKTRREIYLYTVKIVILTSGSLTELLASFPGFPCKRQKLCGGLRTELHVEEVQNVKNTIVMHLYE